MIVCQIDETETIHLAEVVTDRATLCHQETLRPLYHLSPRTFRDAVAEGWGCETCAKRAGHRLEKQRQQAKANHRREAAREGVQP